MKSPFLDGWHHRDLGNLLVGPEGEPQPSQVPGPVVATPHRTWTSRRPGELGRREDGRVQGTRSLMLNDGELMVIIMVDTRESMVNDGYPLVN